MNLIIAPITLILSALLLMQQNALASHAIFNEENNVCTAESSTHIISEAPLQHKGKPISSCGSVVKNADAFLTQDLHCKIEDVQNTAAITVEHGSLDLNGHNIILSDSEPLSVGIHLSHQSKVYDSQQKSEISNFRYGVKIEGDENKIQDFTVSKGQNGVVINGHHNQIIQINVQDTGIIIDRARALLAVEGKGFVVNGDNNHLINTSTRNMGYEASNIPSTINNMYAYAESINLQGQNNLIQYHSAENTQAWALANNSGRAYANGIVIVGSHNIIEASHISTVTAQGMRLDVSGGQTGGVAYGIFLSNDANELNGNIVSCSSVKDILTISNIASDAKNPGSNITAESYGISAIYNNHIISNNNIAEVDAQGGAVTFAAGIRAVDNGHIIQNNTSINHGHRTTSSDDNEYVNAFGISISSKNVVVQKNIVNNNNGYGIYASSYSSDGLISLNQSTENFAYDYFEKADASKINECRNNWEYNLLHNTQHSPRACF